MFTGLALFALLAFDRSVFWIYALILIVSLVYAGYLYRGFAHPRTFDQMVENSGRRALLWSYPEIIEEGCLKGLLSCVGMCVLLMLVKLVNPHAYPKTGVVLSVVSTIPVYTDLLFASLRRLVLRAT